MNDLFDLTGRVAVITGGGGLLGPSHARAIARHGGIPVLVDIRQDAAEQHANEIAAEYGGRTCAMMADITRPDSVHGLLEQILAKYGRIDILVNNAANNPKVEAPGETAWSQVENLPLAQWNADIAVGLTGTFLCCQVLGGEMARRGSGAIIDLASYLGILCARATLVPERGRSRRPAAGQADQLYRGQERDLRPDALPRRILGRARRPRQRIVARWGVQRPGRRIRAEVEPQNSHGRVAAPGGSRAADIFLASDRIKPA